MMLQAFSPFPTVFVQSCILRFCVMKNITKYFISLFVKIDPEVLRELPQDIRVQVEKEMESRKKSTTVRNHGSGPGCSYWEESSADNFEDIVEPRGDNSNPEAPQQEPSLVESDIVPLPSSSQVCHCHLFQGGEPVHSSPQRIRKRMD